MTDYCLLAVSGDCSATGMTDKAEVLPVPAKHLDAVSAYLRNQLEIDLASAAITCIEDAEADIFCKLVNEHNKLGNTLIEKGVFHHKYHKRTNWALTST
tara:strand:+ start:888 stop:1184 length:297 start_codon:yes stop_codon:yes gene_type:complete